MEIVSRHKFVTKSRHQIICIYLSITYFYKSKLRLQSTPLNYAGIAGGIFTENYVEKKKELHDGII
jgi:hypothetical protein